MFQGYAWMRGPDQDPPPSVGDIIYRFALTGAVYCAGISIVLFSL